MGAKSPMITKKNGRTTKSTTKTVVIIFFNYHDLIYNYTCPTKTTNNAQYYIVVMKQLMKDHILKKQPGLIRKWKLHQDNAQPHVTRSVTITMFLTINNAELDLAPNDFFLYPTMKKKLKGKHFPTRMAAIKALDVIFKHMEKRGFQNVLSRVAVTLEKMHSIAWWLLRTWQMCWCLILNYKGSRMWVSVFIGQPSYN